MAPIFGKVEDLEAGKSKFGLELRLIRLYDVPEFKNQDQIFSLEAVFHDKTGARVHASIQRNLIPKFRPLLQEGNVYAIMNYIVSHNNMKFKTAASKFKILVFRNTRIVEVDDENFLNQLFKFKSFDAIAATTKDDENNLFDVIGILGSPYRFQIKEVNGRQLRLCEIPLENLNGETIACTLWEDYATKLIEFLQGEPKRPLAIIIQFCKKNTYRGDITVTNSYCATNIIFPGGCQELEEIKNKYLENLNKTEGAKIPDIIPYVVVQDEICPLKTLADLQNEKESGEYWVDACIYSVDSIGAWAYLACTICLTKLKPDTNQFYCQKCDSTQTAGRYRYKLTVRVVDDTSTAAFHLWDKECFQLIGKTASELNEGGELEDFPPEIIELEDKKALFKVVIKEGEALRTSAPFNVTKVICNTYEIEKFYDSRAQDERTDEVQIKEHTEDGGAENLKCSENETTKDNGKDEEKAQDVDEITTQVAKKGRKLMKKESI